MPAHCLEALTVILGIALLLLEAFGAGRGKRMLGPLAVGGLAVILVLTLLVKGPATGAAENGTWLVYAFDPLARCYKVLALACTIGVTLLSIDYREILGRYTEDPVNRGGTGEFLVLPVFACAGMMWMASARDMVGAFVALELVTVTFYILVAYLRRNVGSLEAGVKYVILGALSTGFLVYGIAWTYGATGSLSFDGIGRAVASGQANVPGLLFGVALVLVALGFKVGAVPMQVWIPDVYQGAPTPVTAFLSVGSKAAGFVVLLRFLDPVLSAESTRGPVLTMLLIMAVATLLVGNLAAIPQTNFKRLLAYSSISHAGFLILALASGAAATPNRLGAAETVSFYLATYLVMTLGAFFALAQVRVASGSEQIDAFNGLGQRNPGFALALTVLLAALAGVPLTAGFLGKWFVFQLAVEAKLWWGVGIAFIGAAAGFYYYFKVIRAMFWNQAADDAPLAIPKITRRVMATCAVVVLVLGVFPQPILWLLQ